MFSGSLNKLVFLNDLMTLWALDKGIPYVLNYPHEILTFPPMIEELEWSAPSMMFEEVD